LQHGARADDRRRGRQAAEPREEVRKKLLDMLERADTGHLAFGGGAHFCLGAPLARPEAQIAIPMLFERFPCLLLDPQQGIEHKSAPGSSRWAT
jgi:cytochrome P450